MRPAADHSHNRVVDRDKAAHGTEDTRADRVAADLAAGPGILRSVRVQPVPEREPLAIAAGGKVAQGLAAAWDANRDVGRGHRMSGAVADP